jgi:hypothetical protein
MVRGWSLGLYMAGIAALAVGVLVGGIVAAATGSAAGFSVAAVIGGAGIATGALALWESRRLGRRASGLEQTAWEHEIWSLAESNGGALRVIDVARALQLMRPDAEALLDALVDEVRVSMQVNDDGEIRYVFRELEAAGPPRVRVDLAEAVSPAEAPEEELAAKGDLND